MQNRLKVGLPIIGSDNWMGGVSYTELLVRALYMLPQEERPNLLLIIEEHNIKHYELYKGFLELFKEIIYVGEVNNKVTDTIYRPYIWCKNIEEIFEKIDFYFPVFSTERIYGSYAGWIPDFQHRYLPQFFSKDDYNYRNQEFEKLARKSLSIVFSSKNAQKDFRKFYSESKVITNTLSFYACPQESWYDDNPVEVQKKYNLPDEFLLCCNQFWVHKDHKTLFEAIHYLYNHGYPVNLVCTGATKDYRAEMYFSNLISYLKANGIDHLVYILGIIPRKDQIQLIRRSLAVVQPSLFEGWSTIVEECRALGKTIVLSDLEVNVEQSPEHGIYFQRKNYKELAKKILNTLPSLFPGPDLVREEDAKEKNMKFIKNYARNFCNIIRQSQEEYEKFCKKKGEGDLLILYNNKGVDIKTSNTYQSILNQSYQNYEIIINTIENVDLFSIQHKYLYLIEEGYILNKYFFEKMLIEIEDKEYIGCRLKCLDKHNNIFFKPIVPIPTGSLKETISITNAVKECIIFRSDIFNNKDTLDKNLLRTNITNIIENELVRVELDCYIRKILNNCRNKRLFIYGAGGHTQYLLNNLNLDEYNICGIFDKNKNFEGKILNGYKIIGSHSLNIFDIDYILISSASHENEIYEELKEYIDEDKIIKIYNSIS